MGCVKLYIYGESKLDFEFIMHIQFPKVNTLSSDIH